MSLVQERGEAMMRRHGFLGVPVETFEQAGRHQFIALLKEGLNPESKVLDIGCGCLRTAYWLVRFLDRGGYFGIEPAGERIEIGLRYLLTPEVQEQKQPRFDSNPSFDFSVFGVRFDFFLAGSIWSHASKTQLQTSLDAFVGTSTSTGVLLASYLRARSPEEDYRGDTWVGTSHVSATPGVIRHALPWIEEQCRRRGLHVAERGEAFDGQAWLRVSHTPPASW